MVSGRFSIFTVHTMTGSIDAIGPAPNENGGVAPAVFDIVDGCGSYRNNCSTLACDWLASASAETAIDCLVESAWLFAASSLVSARVRFDEPVCSTLIRFLAKSWRIWTIDRLDPSDDACERNVVLATLSAARVLLAAELSMKSTPAINVGRPRPTGVSCVPVMLSVDFPVSLNTNLSVSPASRLTPLKDASCEVVVICAMTLLYCATRLARAACEVRSATGGAAVVKVSAPVTVPPMAPPSTEEPSVEEA